MLSSNTILIRIDSIVYSMTELDFFRLLFRKPNMNWEYA